MPVESEGKKAQKTGGVRPSEKSTAGAHAWHVPGLPPDSRPAWWGYRGPGAPRCEREFLQEFFN